MIKAINNNGFNQVISLCDIKEKTVLLQLQGILKHTPNKYSLQVNQTEHLHPINEDELTMHTLIWPYLNHSCNPNTKMNVTSLELIALRNISANEEITFDYNTTEWIISSPFQCNCKSEKCKGIIRGKKFQKSTQEYA